MSGSSFQRRSALHFGLAVISAAILCVTCAATRSARAASPASAGPAASAAPADVKPPTGPTTKLKLRVLDDEGKPVGNASVYVRFYAEGGNFIHHHEQLAELDLKTNNDGTVKIPPVPRGKILIQVIAKNWHTFGKWYKLEKPVRSITIKLEPPPHWY